MNIYEQLDLAGLLTVLSIDQLQVLVDTLSPGEPDRDIKERLIRIEIDRQERLVHGRNI